MVRMKKVLAVLMTASMAMSLAACGGTTSGSTAATSKAASTATASTAASTAASKATSTAASTATKSTAATSTASGNKEVNLWATGSDNVQKIYQTLTSNFNSSQSNYTVKLNFILSGTGTQTLVTKMKF